MERVFSSASVAQGFWREKESQAAFFTRCKQLLLHFAFDLSLLFFLLNAVAVRPPFQFSANSNDDRQSESSNFYFEGIVIAENRACFS